MATGIRNQGHAMKTFMSVRAVLRMQEAVGFPRHGATPGLGLLAGSALGLVLTALLWGGALLEVWTLHQEIAQMQAQHQQVAATMALSDPPSVETVGSVGDGPGVSERDVAWLWLQRRMQAHGLQVEVLKPEALQTGAVLASQLAHVRLQGAWADWMAFDQQLAKHAPWWHWTRWQVLPSGQAGQVQIEAWLRLWLQPDRTQSLSERVWPMWPAVPTRSPARLFATADGSAPEPAAQALAPVSRPAWRLWGVWHQDDQARVVLGRGADWTMLAPGAVLGTEGYRLDHIGVDGAHLKGPGTGQVLFLPWEARP